MILEFIGAFVVGLFVMYLVMKLIGMYQLKRLKKKYPEGSVNNSKPVTRFDEIPIEKPKEVGIIDNKQIPLDPQLQKILEELQKRVVEVPKEEEPEVVVPKVLPKSKTSKIEKKEKISEEEMNDLIKLRELLSKFK